MMTWHTERSARRRRWAFFFVCPSYSNVGAYYTPPGLWKPDAPHSLLVEGSSFTNAKLLEEWVDYTNPMVVPLPKSIWNIVWAKLAPKLRKELR